MKRKSKKKPGRRKLTLGDRRKALLAAWDSAAGNHWLREEFPTKTALRGVRGDDLVALHRRIKREAAVPDDPVSRLLLALPPGGGDVEAALAAIDSRLAGIRRDIDELFARCGQ